MIIEVLPIIFASAFLSSLILVWCVRRFAFKLRLLDYPNERKVHSRTMPKGGGIAIMLSFLIAVFLGYYLLSINLGKALTGFTSQVHRDTFLIIGGGLAISILGLIDDYRSLSPLAKIIVESIIAVVLFCYDIRITLFVHNSCFSLVTTCLWLLLITNAFNLLDNMDGLSAGVAFISGSIFLAVAVQTQQWNIAFFLVGLLGSILGFLCYNFPPATIFMGDCGSLVIGYFMAVLTIHATFYQSSGSVFPIALPLLVMAVPLFDTGTVIWIRWREKRPIFRADTKHFSHRLVRLGMTQRQAILTIYLITFATGISATFLYRTDTIGGIIIILQIVAILAIIRILEQVGPPNG